MIRKLVVTTSGLSKDLNVTNHQALALIYLLFKTYSTFTVQFNLKDMSDGYEVYTALLFFILTGAVVTSYARKSEQNKNGTVSTLKPQVTTKNDLSLPAGSSSNNKKMVLAPRDATMSGRILEGYDARVS